MGTQADKRHTRRMKYIVMCGGEYPLFETPRQMIEVDGEPIVARTIRLLREQGVEDIAISSNNREFKKFGVPVLRHDNGYSATAFNHSTGYWCDCFYPAEEPACYILGDVVFSKEAIKTIVEYETDDIMLFGSKYPFADEYPKPYREPFAFKVANQKHLHEACDELKALDMLGVFKNKPIAWELWSIITGHSPNKINNSYVAINDYTCDIDYPYEIPLFEKLISRV